MVDVTLDLGGKLTSVVEINWHGGRKLPSKYLCFYTWTNATFNFKQRSFILQ